MATTAAVLQVLVDAETGKATLALRKLDKQLAGVDKTTATATTRTSNLGKASSKAGSMLKGAAVSAASAAAAYVSISQAKSAVETTQNLANASFTLSRNLGLTTKQASRWASVAQTRDISTKQLNASFTTLTQKLVDARSGTDEAMESFEALGITQRDLDKDGKSFNKTLFTVADALENAKGGAERQAAAAALLGRGYQTLVPILGQGSDALREQLALGDKYGSTMGKTAVAAQMKLTASLRESQRAWQGLQVTFASAITPALQTANKEFQRMSEIMADKKLTNAEKFKQVGAIIEKWASRAFDAFIDIFPKIIQKAAEQGPKIAKALIQGFTASNLMGKITIAALLIGSNLGNGIKAGLKRSGIGLAIVAAFEVFNRVSGNYGEMVAQQWAAGFGTKLQDAIARQSIPALKRLIRIAEQTTEALHALGWGGAAEEVAEEAEKSGEQARRALDRLQEKTKQTSTEGGKNFDKYAAKSGEMGRKVAGNVNNMARAALGGISHLTEQTNKALKGYGAKTLGFKIDLNLQNKGGQSGFQRGGMIPGVGSGDRVPVMAEPGEGFINKRATAALGGPSAINAINSMMPRFATGGMVGLQPGISRLAKWANQRYGLNISSGLRAGTGSLHNIGAAVDLVPPSMKATQGIFGAFKNQLAELFYDPWGGWNDGQMIGPIGDHLDHIHAAILGAGGPTAMTRLGRPRLQGPAGPLRNIGQGALNKVRSAAQRYLSRHAMTSHGNLGIGNISGPLQGIARRMVTDRWGAGQWPPFSELVMRESGWDPTAVNPSSGAAGLAQALPPSKYPPGAWPYTGKSSAVKQLQWMISYISGRYGTPAGAIDFHNAHNWYQSGGIVGLQAGASVGQGAGGGGRGTGKVAGGRLKDKLRKIMHKIARTDEEITIAQSLAGLERSPAGSELSAGEKSQQVRLHERLLGHLQRQRHIAGMGLRIATRTKSDPTMWRDSLREVAGLTGRGGRLFDTRLALAELHSQALGGAGGISIADLLRIAEGARLGLGPGVGPSFGSGGTVPGPIGQPRPVIAHGGEYVGAPDIRVYIGDRELTDIVRVEVDGRDRKTNLRSRAGVI
jgi:hypothetical protein